MIKEDKNIQEIKKRLGRWWNNEDTDRPCMGYNHPFYGKIISSLNEVTDFYIPFCLARNPDGIEVCLDQFEELKQKIYSGGENIYSFFPNYGAGCLAAILGIEPEYQKGSNKYGAVGETVWYMGKIHPDNVVSHIQEIELNNDNEWYARYLRVIEYAAKRAQKDYTIAMTDVGGVLDVLSSLLGPEKLILTMRRNPEIIDECCRLILEKILILYDSLQAIIDNHCQGCDSWLNLWCPDHYYPIQCDFAAMLNPKWFKRFALPYIEQQAEHMDHAVYHLDGENQIVHLDDLLALESLDGIQWVPGAGKEITASYKWMSLYEKIQAAGKKVILNQFEDPTLITEFYHKLNPDLLYISCFFLDEIRAEFYLPEFIGGEGAKGNFGRYKRKRKKELREKDS
jgi:5-methyltetrahydrofolate--homocysteine methyltransferase